MSTDLGNILPPVLPSLIERLVDTGQPTGWLRSYSRTDLIHSLCNDLRDLWSTSRPATDWILNSPTLKKSVLGYGLARAHTQNLMDKDEMRSFCLAIEEAIHSFEPRLVQVTVEPQPIHEESPGKNERVEASGRVSLMIRGVLHSDRFRVPIELTTEVEAGAGVRSIDERA